jgi:hypothetical protein
MKETVHIDIDNLQNPMDSFEGEAYTSALAQLHSVAPLLRQIADFKMLKQIQNGHNKSTNFEGLIFSRGGVGLLDEFMQDIETYAGEYESLVHPEEPSDPHNSLSEIN